MVRILSVKYARWTPDLVGTHPERVPKHAWDLQGMTERNDKPASRDWWPPYRGGSRRGCPFLAMSTRGVVSIGWRLRRSWRRWWGSKCDNRRRRRPQTSPSPSSESEMWQVMETVVEFPWSKPTTLRASLEMHQEQSRAMCSILIECHIQNSTDLVLVLAKTFIRNFFHFIKNYISRAADIVSEITDILAT